MQTKMFTFMRFLEGKVMNICLQEHSSDYLLCHKKRQGEASDWVSEVQLALYEETVCLKRIIVVWRSPLQRSVE